MKKISIGLVLVIAVSMIFSGCKKEEVYRVVKINHFEGEVTVLRDEKMNAFEGLQLISEDTVETGESSKAELLADSDKHILAEENTKFVLKATGTEKSGALRGWLWCLTELMLKAGDMAATATGMAMAI